MTNKTIVRLENWSMHVLEHDPWTPPELIPRVLYGDVYGHPKEALPDGHEIRTSRVLHLDLDNGWAETLNTIYMLGDPEPKYVF